MIVGHRAFQPEIGRLYRLSKKRQMHSLAIECRVWKKEEGLKQVNNDFFGPKITVIE